MGILGTGTNGLWPAFWMIFNVVIGIALLGLVSGLVKGLFTYGKSDERRKREPVNVIEAGLEFGEALMHWVLDRHYASERQRRGEPGADLTDRAVLARLRKLKPAEFEELIADMFRRMGYEARVVGGAGDGGIDIRLFKDGRRSLVQCKKYITHKVSPSEVRDFYGAMTDNDADGKSFFITTNIFTLAAERFAEGKPMELIDQTALVPLVRETGTAGALEKDRTDRAADARTCPACGHRLVVRTVKKTGERFLGCSAFPECRYTRDL